MSAIRGPQWQVSGGSAGNASYGPSKTVDVRFLPSKCSLALIARSSRRPRALHGPEGNSIVKKNCQEVNQECPGNTTFQRFLKQSFGKNWNRTVSSTQYGLPNYTSRKRSAF